MVRRGAGRCCRRFEIDLRQIKDRLQGPPGQQVALDVVNAIPTCAANQQPQLSLTQLPECLPQVFDREVVAEQVAATLSAAAAQMPGQYDIGPRLAPGTRFGLMFNGRRVGVELLDTSLLLLAVITVGRVGDRRAARRAHSKRALAVARRSAAGRIDRRVGSQPVYACFWRGAAASSLAGRSYR